MSTPPLIRSVRLAVSIGVVTTCVAVVCFRWGRRELVKQLSDPDRKSATGF